MRRHAVLPILLLAVSLAACGKSLPSSAGVTKTVTTHGAGTSTSGGGSGGGTNGGGSAGGTHGGGSAGGTNGGGGRAGEHAGGGASHSQAQARARAFATAVNIRASDVPGFAVSSEKQPQHKGATETRAEDELHHCLGGGRAAPGLAEASSGSFERKAGLASQSVSSSVSVERSAASGEAVLGAFRSGRLRACLSRYFDLLLSAQKIHGASISPVTVKHGSPPAPGVTGSFGLRFTATITLDRLRIPFYVDVLGFVDRSAEVSLLTTGIPQPFPARSEERLFSLLLERAKAHSV